MGGDACVAFVCNTNYASSNENTSVFYDKDKDPDLYNKWVIFVNRGNNWKPNKKSVLCAKHFDECFIKIGEKRNHLKRKLRPIPTIHTPKALEHPSALQTPSIPRKAPKVRVYQEDEIGVFLNQDKISYFYELDARHCPPGYEFKKFHDCVVYFNSEFDPATSFHGVWEYSY